MPERPDDRNAYIPAGAAGIDPSLEDKVSGAGNANTSFPLDDVNRGLLSKLSDRFFRYLRYLAR